MGFFRDDDDDRYAGQTGDPVHDEIYGWDMGSRSDSNCPFTPESDYSYEESSDEMTDDEKLDGILNYIDIPLYQKMALKNKIISFLNSKDCTGLSVEGWFDSYNFIFTREKKYVKTVNEFVYLPILGYLKRVFQDCYTRHYYDNLLRESQFQDLVRSTGFQFIECDGGYVMDYSGADDEFTMKDEMDIGVYFQVGSKKRRYKLDLDRMELSRDYFEY